MKVDHVSKIITVNKISLKNLHIAMRLGYAVIIK